MIRNSGSPTECPSTRLVMELVEFLQSSRQEVRLEAARVALGLTGDADGISLLSSTTVLLDNIRNLIGDSSPSVQEAILKCLVNVSGYPPGLEALSSNASTLVSQIMECLREADTTPPRHRLAVLLLANLSQAGEGCAAILQTGSALAGLQFRRLIQLFLTGPSGGGGGAASTPPSAAAGSTGDAFEHLASVLQNVSKLEAARTILMDAERGIAPGLIRQLIVIGRGGEGGDGSSVRIAGVAGVLRNCLLPPPAPEGGPSEAWGDSTTVADKTTNTSSSSSSTATTTPPSSSSGSTGIPLSAHEKYLQRIDYLLSPFIDVVQSLLHPLAGPDRYRGGETDGMPPILLAEGSQKKRESSPSTRRALVECILLLAHTRQGRVELRKKRAYPVLRLLHLWIEETAAAEAARSGGASSAAKHVAPQQSSSSSSSSSTPSNLSSNSSSSSSSSVGSSSASGETLLTSDSAGGGGEGSEEEDDTSELNPDDEETINAINRIVIQLFRDDEIAHTSEVTGIPEKTPNAAPAYPSESPFEFPALSDSAVAKKDANGLFTSTSPASSSSSSSSGGEGASQKKKFYTVVPLEEAQAAAKRVTKGAELTEEELASGTKMDMNLLSSVFGGDDEKEED